MPWAAMLWALGCSGNKDTEPTGETAEPGPQWTVLGDQTNLPAAALLSIWGSSTDMFIVGADDGSGPVVLHWDGAAWSRLDTSAYPGDLWWVWSDGGDQVFIGGQNARMLTYTRSTGSLEETIITNNVYTIFGVWGSSPSDIWAVGGDVSGANPGIIVHYDGTAWTDVTTVPEGEQSPDSPRQAFKVWGAAPDDVWVVGTLALAMHWDGTSWTPFPEPVYKTSILTTVAGTGPDDVWAVGGPGNARVAHWDGSVLVDDSPAPAEIVPGFNGVAASAAHGVVACGENGSIYWRTDTGWEADARARATAWSFHACWLDEQGSAWAVGGDLTLLTEGVIIYGGQSVQPVDL